MGTLTKVQEVFFDLCDLSNSDEIDDIRINCLPEFTTVREFLVEQRDKMAQIEAEVRELESQAQLIQKAQCNAKELTAKAVSEFHKWEMERYGENTPLADMHVDMWVEAYKMGYVSKVLNDKKGAQA